MNQHYTLALNMIVGAGDGDVLDRCLSAFDCKNLFDEIVIVTTTNDKKVKDVADKWATKVLSKTWTNEEYPFGDFAGARNLALDNTVSDYVMWLDADDIMTGANINTKLKNLREYIDELGFEVFFVNYCLERDDNGNETWAIVRERIWKRATGVQWLYPVHEQLPFDWATHRKTRITGITNIHQPLKLSQTGINRNLKILEHEYTKPDKRENHIAYYYARDLMLSAPQQEGLPILVDLVKNFDGNEQNIFESCMALTKYYLYDKMDSDGFHSINKRHLDIAEGYCRIAMSISEDCAETVVYMGDINLARNKKENAILQYKKAMGKEYGNGAVQQVAYYEAIPAARLSALFIEQEEWEQALWYNKLAKDFFRNNEALKKDRNLIVSRLAKENV